MWPYVVLIMLPVFFQHIKFKSVPMKVMVRNHNTASMKLFWCLLLFMLVLRNESVGRDLYNYKLIFREIASSSWMKGLWRSTEIGYNFLNKTISLFTDDFQWVIVLTAIFGVWYVAKAYIKYSEDVSLTIALFIVMSNFVLLFSGLRQAIAISISFIAFECVRKKKKIAFLLTVIFAMTFHTSAFMLLFMYPLYYAKITKKWITGIVLLLGGIYVFNRQIFGALTLFLSMFTKYEGEITSTGAYTMLFLFIAFAVFSYIIPDEKKLDSDALGMRNYLLLAVALQMFAPLHNIAMRINYYYIIFIPLLIPKIIKFRSKRWNQVAVLARHVMVVFFIAYFFLTAPRDNVLDTFPYRFFWEETLL